MSPGDGKKGDGSPCELVPTLRGNARVWVGGFQRIHGDKGQLDGLSTLLCSLIIERCMTPAYYVAITLINAEDTVENETNRVENISQICNTYINVFWMRDIKVSRSDIPELVSNMRRGEGGN